MTFFGFIWLLVVLFTFFTRDTLHFALLTIFFMLFQSVNIIVLPSGQGIGPQILTSILFLVRYALTKPFHPLKLNKKKIFENSIIVLFVLEIILSTYMAGNLFDRFLYIIQIGVYFLCFGLMRNCLGKDNINLLNKTIREIIIFVVILGIIQFFACINILPIKHVLSILFFNDTSQNVFFHYDFFPRVTSLFMEPSYFAAFAVGSFYFLLSKKNELKKNVWLLIVLFLEIILTKSSTAYGSFFVIGILFVLFSNDLKDVQKFLIILIALIGFMLLYFCFYDLLDTVIFSKTTSSSGLTRSYWNINAMNEFYSKPFFGCGYKNTRGSSIIFSLLGELGSFGLMLYILFNIRYATNIIFCNKKRKIMKEYNGVIFGLLAAIVCQIIACPDLDLCSYWYWLYILALYNGCFI